MLDTSTSFVMNERLSTKRAMEIDAAVATVRNLISVDAGISNTVPAVLFLQLLAMLEIGCLIGKLAGIGLTEDIGLLRLCVIIKPGVLWMLERVVERLLWWMERIVERLLWWRWLSRERIRQRNGWKDLNGSASLL